MAQAVRILTRMEMRARTEAGGRFVDVARSHVEPFAARASELDAESRFAAENYEDLKKSGAMGAFVPVELGGLGLESVHDWAAGLAMLARGDASTAIALNMHLGVSRTLVAAYHGAKARGDADAEARNGGMLKAVANGDLVICATATEAGTAPTAQPCSEVFGMNVTATPNMAPRHTRGPHGPPPTPTRKAR